MNDSYFSDYWHASNLLISDYIYGVVNQTKQWVRVIGQAIATNFLSDIFYYDHIKK